MAAVVEGRGLPVAQYDAVAEWEAETLEEILEIFVSDEYKEVCKQIPGAKRHLHQLSFNTQKLRPDEAKFFYRESVQVMVGKDQSDYGQYRPDLEWKYRTNVYVYRVCCKVCSSWDCIVFDIDEIATFSKLLK